MESLILSTLNKKKTVLDQLVMGLQALDVLDHIRKKPILFEPLFVNSPTEDLTAGRVMSVLSFTEDEAPSKEHLLRFIGDSCKSGMLLYCLLLNSNWTMAIAFHAFKVAQRSRGICS